MRGVFILKTEFWRSVLDAAQVLKPETDLIWSETCFPAASPLLFPRVLCVCVWVCSCVMCLFTVSRKTALLRSAKSSYCNGGRLFSALVCVCLCVALPCNILSHCCPPRMPRVTTTFPWTCHAWTHTFRQSLTRSSKSRLPNGVFNGLYSSQRRTQFEMRWGICCILIDCSKVKWRGEER